MLKYLSSVCAIAATCWIATSAAARANCIAHQPPNMRFTAPASVPLTWKCVTAGPLYDHARRWFIITFKVTNHGPHRTQALKLQANVVDVFGDVLATIPITENANLGGGDSDGAVFAFHPPFSANGVDHVAFYLLAVKWSDGSVWHAPEQPKAGRVIGGDVALQRFSMRWDNYDIAGEIVPSPSPSPSPRGP